MAGIDLNQSLEQELNNPKMVNSRGELRFIDAETLEISFQVEAPSIGWTICALLNVEIPSELEDVNGGLYIDDWHIGSVVGKPLQSQ